MQNLRKRSFFLNFSFLTILNGFFFLLCGFNFLFCLFSFLLFFLHFLFEWRLLLHVFAPIKKVLKSAAVDNLERRGFFSVEKIHKKIRAVIDEKNENEEILNSLIEGVLVLDKAGTVSYANEMAKKIFQDTLLKKKTFKELPKTAFLNSCMSLVKEAQKAKALQRKAFLLEEKAKNYFDVVALPRKEKSVLLIFQDKTADYKMLQMGKEFVANSSHELRTPITIIRGFAETLQDLPQLSSKMLKEITEKIINTSKRLENIISNLLILADLDNLGALKLVSCDLNEVLEKQKDELLLLHPKAEVNLKVPGDRTEVLLDRGLLELAIRNLLENAVKYSDNSPKVSVQLEKKEREISLTIQDDGIGIAPEDLEHVFERFYTVDKARSRKNGGVGLGLSLVKNIIEKHQGKIELVSTLKEGTVFIIKLPLFLPLS